jgi:hypothetical protein
MKKKYTVSFLLYPKGDELFGDWSENRTIYLMRRFENSDIEKFSGHSLYQNQCGLSGDILWRRESFTGKHRRALVCLS